MKMKTWTPLPFSAAGKLRRGRGLKLKLLKTYEKNFKSSREMELPRVGAECWEPEKAAYIPDIGIASWDRLGIVSSGLA